MSYAIFRMQKVHTNNIGNLEMHNERKTNNHSNKDINIELSKNNVQLIECKSYKKAIQNNINKYYKSDRNIRKDAVIAVETIFTSDFEFFKNKTDEEKQLFFEKSLEFLKEFVGEKNIIAATIHNDETTPHMHCVFTPIDNEGKLKYKSFVSHKNDLVKLQDNYHKKVSQVFPELERGKSAKETKRKHIELEEYKELQKIKKINENLQDELEKNNNLTKKIEKIVINTGHLEEKLQKKTKKMQDKQNKYNYFQEKIENLEEEIEKMKLKNKNLFSEYENFKITIEKNIQVVEKQKNRSKKIKDEVQFLQKENEKLEELYIREKEKNQILEEKTKNALNSFEETLKDGLEAIKEQYFTIPNRGIPRKSDKINLHNQEEFASMLYCRELLKLVQGNLEEIPGYSFLQKKARDSTIMIIENTLDNGKSRGGWER